MSGHRRTYWFGIAIVVGTTIAGCNGGVGGSGSSGVNPSAQIAPVADAQARRTTSTSDKHKHRNKGEVRIVVRIPPKQLGRLPGTVTLPVGRSRRARLRAPKYVSPNTKSMTVSVPGQPVQSFNLTPTSSSCSTDTDTGYLTCTETAFFPIGQQTITITLYDHQNGQGNELSSGTVTTTIVAGAVNTISVTLDGIAATAAVLLAGASSANIPQGTPTSLPVTVSVYDADGNLILLPGHYDASAPVTLSDSDGSGVTSLSTTSVKAPGSNITLSYNGGSLSSAMITVKVNGVAQGNPATLTVGAPPTPAASPSSLSFGTAATQTFTVQETGYSGAFSASSSDTTVATVSPSSADGPSATFTVTPIGGGTCTITVTDSHSNSATVSVSVNGGVIVIDETPVATPTSLTFDTAASQTFNVKEKQYSGLFTESDDCSGIASTNPGSTSGPNATFTVTPVGGGSCTVTVSDNQENTATVSVSVSGGSIIIDGKHGKQPHGGK